MMTDGAVSKKAVIFKVFFVHKTGFLCRPIFFSWRWGGSSTQAWMPTHDSVLRIPPDDMSLESDGGIILTGENRRTRRKTCPSATLSTTNPTWIQPVANPSLRGEWPATNDLSHDTA
jgi:hypothetical protein